jgi:hypothetical protein
VTLLFGHQPVAVGCADTEMIGHTLAVRAYEELVGEGNSGLAVAVTLR